MTLHKFSEQYKSLNKCITSDITFLNLKWKELFSWLAGVLFFFFLFYYNFLLIYDRFFFVLIQLSWMDKTQSLAELPQYRLSYSLFSSFLLKSLAKVLFISLDLTFRHLYYQFLCCLLSSTFAFVLCYLLNKLS